MQFHRFKNFISNLKISFFSLTEYKVFTETNYVSAVSYKSIKAKLYFKVA